MKSLRVEYSVLYRGKNVSTDMNELRYPGTMRVKSCSKECRGGEHRLNTGPPELLTV
ncbi:DraP [Escherichia coli]|uniref:DraP n=1 Tax=Escherichia coli TaxID=562 RepID=UPI0011152A56|nr:DraP [Escherichia coli]EET4711915.1 DraP [Escherichia coli]EEZ7964212.1 DraP [Escherichia coli]EFA0251060.1 DraP [Escherichia coli]EJA1280876.1 DraP [Escherichia coli]EJI4284103.1 DraP [Escherichia coli]